jgi:hypothetical protein
MGDGKVTDWADISSRIASDAAWLVRSVEKPWSAFETA